MSDDDKDDETAYQFDDVDRAIVSIAGQLITKVWQSRLLSAAQREVVRAVARVFAELPDAANDLNASFSVIGPTREFGEHKIHHNWTIELEDQQIEVRAGGYFWRPSTGGDSFISFRWVACPGSPTDWQDLVPTLGIVDDAKPFGTEIEELDLDEPGYSINVTHDGEDVGDPWDDEDDEGDEDEADDQDAVGDETADDEQPAAELTACLWAFMDAETQVIYALGGRAYSLSGSDEAKLQILRGLSRHDHRSVQRLKVPDRFTIQYGNGAERSGVAPPSAVNDPTSMLFQHVLDALEGSLPPLPDFANKQVVPQNFPDQPLCVRTLVYEDAAGNCRAIVDEHDRAWLTKQI
jgi:hypothetical protein